MHIYILSGKYVCTRGQSCEHVAEKIGHTNIYINKEGKKTVVSKLTAEYKKYMKKMHVSLEPLQNGSEFFKQNYLLKENMS